MPSSQLHSPAACSHQAAVAGRHLLQAGTCCPLVDHTHLLTAVTCCLQSPAACSHLPPAWPPVVGYSHLLPLVTCCQATCCLPALRSTTITCCLHAHAVCIHLLPACPPVDYIHLLPAVTCCPPIDHIHMLLAVTCCLKPLCCLPALQSATGTCCLHSPAACLPASRLQSHAAGSHLAGCLPPVDYSHVLPAVNYYLQPLCCMPALQVTGCLQSP